MVIIFKAVPLKNGKDSRHRPIYCSYRKIQGFPNLEMGETVAVGIKSYGEKTVFFFMKKPAAGLCSSKGLNP